MIDDHLPIFGRSWKQVPQNCKTSRIRENDIAIFSLLTFFFAIKSQMFRNSSTVSEDILPGLHTTTNHILWYGVVWYGMTTDDKQKNRVVQIEWLSLKIKAPGCDHWETRTVALNEMPIIELNILTTLCHKQIDKIRTTIYFKRQRYVDLVGTPPGSIHTGELSLEQALYNCTTAIL